MTRPSTPRPLRSTSSASSAGATRATRTTRRPRAAAQPSVRPLLVRAEARYTCFGDGLCCTDIHALGPVTPREKAEVELIEPGRLVRHPDLKAWVFGTAKNGACALRSKRGCELHAVHGAEAKPDGCKRFPYGLVATPDGGRITTEHRCPCRSMGDRPPLSEADALGSLADRAGRLVPNGKVGARVRLSVGKSVSFARYKELETALVEGLLTGAPPAELLRVKPFGRLDGERFVAIADEILEEGKDDASGYGCALTWFGRALHACLDGRSLPLLARPWGRYFDIAERRAGKRSAEAVLADYLADLLWSMDWYFSIGSFHGARRELATLHAIAARITKRLVRAGARPDRAAAEAVMVVELARQCGAWERVQESL